MPNLFVNIISKFDPKGTKQAADSTKKLVNTLKAAAAGLVAAEVVQFGRESLELSREQAKAEAQVAAAITSTGSAAGLTLRQLKAHASALQDVTNFGDEATLAAQSQLLTFTKIGEETFPRATEAILDLATRMDGDLKGATIQVGKALNDPVAGLSALSKAGIQFTDQQKDLIETLVDTGREAEAQSIILDELETQFGGSAEAARDADGGITAMGNSFGDLQEELGFLIADLNEAGEVTEGLIGIFNALGSGIADLRLDLGLTDDVNVQIKSVEGQIRKLEKTAVEISEHGDGSILSRIIGTSSKDTSRIEEEIARLQSELVGLQQQSDAEAAATQEEAGETKIAIEEETNDELLDLRKALAEELIDIQDEGGRDLAENARKLGEDLSEAEGDTQNRISDIVQTGNKDRLKLAERLRKDLQKVEVNLGKSIQKQMGDEDKRVAKIEADAGKNEANKRKRRRIDSLADERLFQFELRQLAAEGQGLAIKEAIERRAIEEQIASEKAEFEKEVEENKKTDQIRTVRAEGAERREQLRLDSTERAGLLAEQHAEELKELAAKVQEDATLEREALTERREELGVYYDERGETIREGEAKGVQEVAAGLTEIEDITSSELAGLAALATELGESAGSNFAEGMEAGFARAQRIEDLIVMAGGGGGRAATGGGSSTPPPFGGLDLFQDGGVVGGSPGRGQMIVAHGGEEIANPNAGQALTVSGTTFAVREAGRMKTAIETLLQTTLQEFTDQFAEEIG